MVAQSCITSSQESDWFISLLTQKEDVIVEKLYESTEEGKKVTRNSGEKFLAVFRRIEDPYLSDQGSS